MTLNPLLLLNGVQKVYDGNADIRYLITPAYKTYDNDDPFNNSVTGSPIA